MATVNYDVPTEATDVVAGASLTVGKKYSAQYLGNEDGELSYWEGANAPAATDTPGRARHHESIIIEPRTGENIYVWGATGVLVINEIS